jgi:hypothetical protein
MPISASYWARPVLFRSSTAVSWQTMLEHHYGAAILIVKLDIVDEVNNCTHHPVQQSQPFSCT